MSTTIDLKIQNAIAENLTKLCEWSANLSITDIPKNVLKNAALILGDNIAATISAAAEPEVYAYHQHCGHPQCDCGTSKFSSAQLQRFFS